jgi:hypothetical protein
LGAVEIRAVRVRNLEAFASDSLKTLQSAEVVPISLSRARAQTRNPHASPDDVGLLVARRDGICIGTLGLVPGLLRAGERLEKVDWLSAWYVPPEHRNTGAGERLLLHALGLRRHLAASEFSAEAGQMYDALRFKRLEPLRYLVADLLRFNVLGLPIRALAKLVRRFYPAWAVPLDRAARAAGWPVKRLILAWLWATTAFGRRRYSVRRVERIDMTEAELDAARDRRAPVRFYRTPAVINWMLTDRWVVTEPRDAVPGYFFSDCDPFFEFVALEVADRVDNQRLGFVVLRTDAMHGRRAVTVLDYHFSDPADERCLLLLGVELARAFRADRIVLPPACREPMKALWPIRPLFRLAERPICLRLARNDEVLNRDLDCIALDLSDGEIAFA